MKEKEYFKDDVKLQEMTEMLKKYWLQKNEICRMFDLTNERRTREKISQIAQVYPVISSSKRQGYKVASESDDIELLKESDRELESRIRELKKRRKPLQREIAKRSKTLER